MALWPGGGQVLDPSASSGHGLGPSASSAKKTILTDKNEKNYIFVQTHSIRGGGDPDPPPYPQILKIIQQNTMIVLSPLL